MLDLTAFCSFDRFKAHVSVVSIFCCKYVGRNIFSSLCLLKENKTFGKKRKENLALKRASIKMMRLERML